VAGLIGEQTPEGEYKVHFSGVEEVVTDKGYHSNDVVRSFTEMELRTYIADRNGESATGKTNQRRKKRSTPTGGASGENEVKGYRPSEARESNATSRISSIPAVWTGYMFVAL